jgi:hypothetical protein
MQRRVNLTEDEEFMHLKTLYIQTTTRKKTTAENKHHKRETVETESNAHSKFRKEKMLMQKYPLQTTYIISINRKCKSIKNRLAKPINIKQQIKLRNQVKYKHNLISNYSW